MPPVPIYHPHLPPVIRGRRVVDVAPPEPELMPTAVASGMERAEKGAARPSPGRKRRKRNGVRADNSQAVQPPLKGSSSASRA